MVWRVWSATEPVKMPPLGPGMNPLFAEQYNVSPAKTHGLAVGLGGIFFGRMDFRLVRSRTATPVKAMCAPSGRLETSMVARAGVFPNSKRFAYCSFIAR